MNNEIARLERLIGDFGRTLERQIKQDLIDMAEEVATRAMWERRSGHKVEVTPR